MISTMLLVLSLWIGFLKIKKQVPTSSPPGKQTLYCVHSEQSPLSVIPQLELLWDRRFCPHQDFLSPGKKPQPETRKSRYSSTHRDSGADIEIVSLPWLQQVFHFPLHFLKVQSSPLTTNIQHPEVAWFFCFRFCLFARR